METSLVFWILACCGCWRPISWTSPCKTLMYNVYSVFMMSIIFTSTAFTVVHVIQSTDTDSFVQNSYMLIPEIIAVCKLINVLVHRKGIINLLNVIQEKMSDTWTVEETKIHTRYNKQIRGTGHRYRIFVSTSVLLNILNSLLNDYPDRQLPYGSWTPYNHSSTIAYHLTYAQQALNLVVLSQVHVAVDVFFIGLLIQTCCQLNILEHRLSEIKSNDDDVLKKCVLHHNFIFELATMVNDTLRITLLAQFGGSIVVLCLILFQLLKCDILSSYFLAMMTFLLVIMFQNFLYCWFATQLKIKSIALSDVIFHTNWAELNEKLKRNLIIIMCRTKSPIEFEVAHVIGVNIEFFLVLIKTSYSAYNLLQNTQK